MDGVETMDKERLGILAGGIYPRSSTLLLRRAPTGADDDDGSPDSVTPSSDLSVSGSAPLDAEKALPPRPASVNPLLGALSRTVSRTEAGDPGAPPNGGLTAWSQTLVVHLVIFTTWGYINSFGVFQSYYVGALGHSDSDISWIGSVQVWLLFFIGTFSGRLTDAGYFRPVFLAGSFFQVFGVFMTSLATNYWQLFLAQGLCTGIGNGLLFCPALALVASYFTTYRSIAIAITASGSATGGLVLPAMVETLLPRIGFPWTMRALAFLMLGLQLFCVALARPRLPPRKAGPWVEWAAFGELPYTLFTFGMFLIFWGLYCGFYYVGAFGISRLGLAYASSVNLLLIMNGVGIVGRMVPAALADRYFGPLNTLLPFALVSGCICFCWAAVGSDGGLYAWAVLYGLFAAGIQSLFPATLSGLTRDPQKMGTRMGMAFTIISFACLTGTPISGALIQARGGAYLYAQAFSGSVILCGTVMLLAARISGTGWTLRARM